jgi:purine nucleosidase
MAAATAAGDSGVAARAVPRRRRIIIDTDCGVDDAQAFFMALRNPAPDAPEVVAITCVHGNTSLANVEGNVCAVLAACGRSGGGGGGTRTPEAGSARTPTRSSSGSSVPVYLGCEGPLVAAHHDATTWHGTDGLGNTGWGAAADRSPVQRGTHAAEALARLPLQLQAEDGCTTDVVTLGPLSNLALAVRLCPRMVDAVGRVYVMGGAVHARGNATYTAEYNVEEDPEAAAIVFDAFPAITMLDWAATTAHALPFAWVKDCWLPRGPTATAAQSWLRSASQHLISACEQPAYAALQFLIPDPLAMAVALRPSVVLRSSSRRVLVELHASLTRGMTVVDWDGRSGRSANVEIVEAVDMDEVRAMLLRSVADASGTEALGTGLIVAVGAAGLPPTDWP